MSGQVPAIVTIPSLIATNFSRLQRASNLSAAFAKVLKWPVMQVVITDAATGRHPWKSRYHPRKSRKSLSVISSIFMMLEWHFLRLADFCCKRGHCLDCVLVKFCPCVGLFVGPCFYFKILNPVTCWTGIAPLLLGCCSLLWLNSGSLSHQESKAARQSAIIAPLLIFQPRAA